MRALRFLLGIKQVSNHLQMKDVAINPHVTREKVVRWDCGIIACAQLIKDLNCAIHVESV
jgi:hypothetical protein